jgi:hypothetical protein
MANASPAYRPKIIVLIFIRDEDERTQARGKKEIQSNPDVREAVLRRWLDDYYRVKGRGQVFILAVNAWVSILPL